MYAGKFNPDFKSPTQHSAELYPQYLPNRGAPRHGFFVAYRFLTDPIMGHKLNVSMPSTEASAVTQCAILSLNNSE